MATQSVGGAPGINESGLVDLLRTGMLIRQQNQQSQQDRQDKSDELDLKRQELSDSRDNAKSVRQMQASMLLNDHVMKTGQDAYDKAIAAGKTEQEAQQIRESVQHDAMRTALGTSMDNIKDTYGDNSPQVQYAMDNMKSSKSNINPTGNTFDPQSFLNKNSSNNSNNNLTSLLAGGGSLTALAALMKSGMLPSGSTLGNPFVGGVAGQANNIQDAYQAAVRGNMMSNGRLGLPNNIQMPDAMNGRPGLPSSEQAGPISMGQGTPRNSPIELPERPMPPSQPYSPEQMQGMQMGAEGGASGMGLRALGGVAEGGLFGALQDRLGTMQAIQSLMNVMRGSQGQQQNIQNWQNANQA